MREEHGNDYGVDHEIRAYCVLKGCTILSPIIEECGGYSIGNPFIDPEDIMTKAIESSNPTLIENARSYCKQVQNGLGQFYEAIGVDLDEIASQKP